MTKQNYNNNNKSEVLGVISLFKSLNNTETTVKR